MTTLVSSDPSAATLVSVGTGPQQVTTAAGEVPVRAPRVDRRTEEASGQRQRFASSILCAAGRSPRVAEVVPLHHPRGVRPDGTKELVAIDDGHLEATGSWAGPLHSTKQRGMRAPVLAVGDGALGFWSARREEFPEIAELLSCLPKSAHPVAKAALAEICGAADREHPTSVPAAVAVAVAVCRRGLRCGVAQRGRQARGRAVNAPYLVALVPAGASLESGLESGKVVERPDEPSSARQVA